jgi:hypothetical protein
MKRVLATVLSVAVALVVPAIASAAVQVTFKNWKVETKNGKQHTVAPKGTFTRCGRTAVQLKATFDYNGATKGKSYKEIWSLDGTELLRSTEHWADTSGTVHAFLNRGGDPIDDGKFKLRIARKDGTTIGSSWIRIRGKPPGGC